LAAILTRDYHRPGKRIPSMHHNLVPCFHQSK
jgi:hypothetical protein